MNIIKIVKREILLFKINSLKKYINCIELNIYFNRYTGKDCIEELKYCNELLIELHKKIKIL